MYTEINEPIEVAVIFKAGRAQPLAFRWHQNTFKVAKVNLMHKGKIGQDTIYTYSLSTDKNDTYQISFNPVQLKWTLNQICE